jgi:DNA gyrase subunit A
MRVVGGDPDQELLFITGTGLVLRTSVGSISEIGRQTQGVIVMRVAPDDKVVALGPVGASASEQEALVGDAPSDA